MLYPKPTRYLSRVWILAAASLAIPALAQQEVNPQSNNAAQTGAPQQSQAGQRVNGELYGNPGAAPVRHYQSTLLPSEQRYIIERTGATPSELRTQADHVGPLSPEGPLAYIPLQSPLQTAVGAAQLHLVNPAYVSNLIPRGPQTPPPPGSPQALHPDFIRPTEPAGAPNYVSPPRVDSGRLLTPPIANSSGTGESTVSHRIPMTRRPTTAPATQPSPGERQ